MCIYKGNHLFILPSSRAIAVASYQDRFDIFILNEFMSRDRFDPIHGRASIEEEGIIWHMDFLYTEGKSRDRILLALVIYNDTEKLCKLVVYAINANDMDNVTVERIGRLPLEKNTPMPLLLVPLLFQPESFLLVTELQICLLKTDDLACGNVFYMTTTIPRPFGTLESSAEGRLFRLDLSSNDEFTWNSIKDINPTSQSMILLGSIGSNDVLFYAGESADSQIIAIHRKELDYTTLQTLMNRAPLTNYQVMSQYQSSQDAIIACSGQDAQGALSIFNYGIKMTNLYLSDQSWSG
ncbi:hypothetical protein K501DRAFT_311983 [Backusella circina FSU 941]|nr:hypothetical protein K501DRAFT_311983 [Backusella circina FSU 941]